MGRAHEDDVQQYGLHGIIPHKPWQITVVDDACTRTACRITRRSISFMKESTRAAHRDNRKSSPAHRDNRQLSRAAYFSLTCIDCEETDQPASMQTAINLVNAVMTVGSAYVSEHGAILSRSNREGTCSIRQRKPGRSLQETSFSLHGERREHKGTTKMSQCFPIKWRRQQVPDAPSKWYRIVESDQRIQGRE